MIEELGCEVNRFWVVWVRDEEEEILSVFVASMVSIIAVVAETFVSLILDFCWG